MCNVASQLCSLLLVWNGHVESGDLSRHPLTLCVSDPIDLTHNQEQDDLQRALALSMQDMHDQQEHQQQSQTGTISYEDQELSRSVVDSA